MKSAECGSDFGQRPQVFLRKWSTDHGQSSGVARGRCPPPLIGAMAEEKSLRWGPGLPGAAFSLQQDLPSLPVFTLSWDSL